MKLGFDAKRALNNSTGLGNHARILLNAMMRDFPENEYHLFSPKAKDEYFHQLHGDFKIHFPQNKLQQIANPLWRSFSIKNDLLRSRLDIYHGLSNEIPFGIHKTGIASVVTIHDLIFLKHKAQYPWLDRQFYETKTRYAAKHADHIIAVSEETKRDLIELYGAKEKKISVIYPSVERNFQTTDDGQQTTEISTKYRLPAKYILNVGSFFPRKNQKTLIEAFDQIRFQVQEDLVLVGNIGTQKQQIEQLITSKNLSDRVHIISNVSNEDLPAVYRNASVFVFPSLFEGFGAPVLEALFSRVPGIATRGNAIEEAAGKSSLLVNPLSVEEIANALLQILSNETLRNKMIEEGYKHAQTMTDTVFAQKTMRVYRSL